MAGRIDSWSIPLNYTYPYSYICVADALAPPLCSLKPRQIARRSHQLLQPDQGDSPLESLVQQERLGYDTQDTATSKEKIKFCATAASVWLAPLVSNCNCLPQISNCRLPCFTGQSCLDQLAAKGQCMTTCSTCSMYCCDGIPCMVSMQIIGLALQEKSTSPGIPKQKHHIDPATKLYRREVLEKFWKYGHQSHGM